MIAPILRFIPAAIIGLSLPLGDSTEAQQTMPAASSAPTVTAQVATVPTAQGESNMAVPTRSGRIIGSAELAGLEIYDSGGRRIGTVAAGEAAGLDIREGVSLAGGIATLLVSADATDNRLRVFRLDDDALTEITARPIELGFAVENVCLHRGGRDGALYAFAVGDGGEVQQLMMFEAADGRVDARPVRRISLPSTVSYCVADDRSGTLYVSQEEGGLWRFDANPEADLSPVLIDAPRIGHVTDELGGVALYDGGQGARWLIAADTSGGRLLVYDREQDDRYVGALSLGGTGEAVIQEPSGLGATSAALGTALPHGGVIVANESARNYSLFDARAIASSLQIAAGSPQGAATPERPPFPAVRARVETVAVPSSGDAADDPAISVNRADPARSLIVGTNKRAGLHLYDMAGQQIQFVADGKMNNVDLREGFRLGGRDVVIVAASNRTTLGVGIYMLDTEGRRLVDVADGIQASGLSDPYGLCLYQSRRSGRLYVFVSDPDGLVRQWQLVATREGRVRLRQVRDLRFSSQTEGCVADDETGTLYVGEEDVGLWRLNAEPSGGPSRTAIDTVEGNPHIHDDVEGVGIYDLGGGRGYIVASSQGNDSYAVYRREGDRAYLGSFIVVADGAAGIDGISETDGLEVTSRNLGPGFEHGAMIAQDGRNVLPSENQNFKIVSWDDIARALNLEVRR